MEGDGKCTRQVGTFASIVSNSSTSERNGVMSTSAGGGGIIALSDLEIKVNGQVFRLQTGEIWTYAEIGLESRRKLHVTL